MRDILEFLRKGSETERFHTIRTILRETVGHHSFNVAWLCWLLEDGAPSAELLMAALAHDITEHKTGDMPSPAKRHLNIRKEFQEYEDTLLVDAGIPIPTLTDREVRTLSMADNLDGMLSCQRERAMGNQLVVEAFENFRRYVWEMTPEGRESELYFTIWGLWRSVHVGE